MNLNKAEIIGNLTRDPQIKTLPSGTPLASFSVATNRIWKDYKTKKQNESTEYHNVIAWGKLAEIIGKYLKKGGKVYVDGRLQTRSWEDKEKIKRQKTEIVADNLIMLGHLNKKPSADLAKEEIDIEEVDIEEA
ncbi:single-stranded DNA-binding protein [Patescibacteria group bacterium]|nr:single-stranded DNA-binding protein [Patescibacteria group bacterium]